MLKCPYIRKGHLFKSSKEVEVENDKRFESVYSCKVRAGKRRTYFFDVRKTKGEDYYVTMTESTRKFETDGYERHKIFLYKEDFNRFLAGLQEVVDHVKTQLMPDYDYEEYERRQAEWEQKRAEEDAAIARGELPPREKRSDATATPPPPTTPESPPADDAPTTTTDSVETEEDMDW